ncbi:hypothetical protein D3C84_1195640 [compost metagenome]
MKLFEMGTIGRCVNQKTGWVIGVGRLERVQHDMHRSMHESREFDLYVGDLRIEDRHPG